MDVSMFVDDTMGELVDITGSDPVTGNWQHKAFIPTPLGSDEPPLSGDTYRMVAAAGRALAALDATTQQLPNPYLLRTSSLRREAQSTSALEGTYAPLREVLTADDDAPATAEMTEILNYVRMANSGFLWAQEGRPITLSLVEDLQGELMRGTPLESASGRLRDTQVMIGRGNMHHHQPYEQASLNSQHHGPAPRENRGRSTCQPPGIRTTREHLTLSLMGGTRTDQHVYYHISLRFRDDCICRTIALHSPDLSGRHPYPLLHLRQRRGGEYLPGRHSPHPSSRHLRHSRTAHHVPLQEATTDHTEPSHRLSDLPTGQGHP